MEGGIVPDKIEAFIILLFLLPGFVGLIVYEIVAEVPKRETFDKVVVAIAITVVATVLHGILGSYYPYFGTPAGLEQVAAYAAAKDDAQAAANLAAARAIIAGLTWTTAIAAGLGLVSAAFQNWGVVHGLLRLLGITRRTGAIDVWHQVFSRGEQCWVRLIYKNGTMLVGYAKYFSEDSKTMALYLAEATWHVPEMPTGQTDFTKIAPADITNYVQVNVNPGVLVTKFDDVVAIEQVG
jgi:hypothetical protein